MRRVPNGVRHQAWFRVSTPRSRVRTIFKARTNHPHRVRQPNRSVSDRICAPTIDATPDEGIGSSS